MAKRANEYAEVLPFDLFQEIPKAVFAAIAVSALTCGGDHLDDAAARVVAEWQALHDAGIVPQKPGRRAMKHLHRDAA